MINLACKILEEQRKVNPIYLSVFEASFVRIPNLSFSFHRAQEVSNYDSWMERERERKAVDRHKKRDTPFKN